MGFHHGPNEADDDRDRHAEAGRRSAARRGERTDRGAIADDPQALLDVLRHLTELLKDKNTSLARLRKLLFGASTEKTAAVLGGEKDSSLRRRGGGGFDNGNGGRRRGSHVGHCRGSGKGRENAAKRARPQRGRRLRRGREDRGASRVAPAGRSLPEVRKGHGLRDGAAGRAGAAGGPGADPGQDLRTPEVAVQPLRRGLHGPARPRALARRNTTPRRAA